MSELPALNTRFEKTAYMMYTLFFFLGDGSDDRQGRMACVQWNFFFAVILWCNAAIAYDAAALWNFVFC